MQTPHTDTPSIQPQPLVAKRKRGRPRKYPRPLDEFGHEIPLPLPPIPHRPRKGRPKANASAISTVPVSASVSTSTAVNDSGAVAGDMGENARSFDRDMLSSLISSVDKWDPKIVATTTDDKHKHKLCDFKPFVPTKESDSTSKVKEKGKTVQDHLVPISFEFEAGGEKVTDSILWNLTEDKISPYDFAKRLCYEYGTPAVSIIESISNQITEQLQFSSARIAQDDAYAVGDKLSSDIDVDVDFEGDGDGSKLPKWDDCVQTIRIEAKVGQEILSDQFEWDVNNLNNSPEEFAKVLCADMGLKREFIPVICQGIAEQLHALQYKTLKHSLGFDFDPTIAYDGILRAISLGTDLRECIRPREADSSEWGPGIDVISKDEMDKIDARLNRERRAKRRRGAVGGLGGVIDPMESVCSSGVSTITPHIDIDSAASEVIKSINPSTITISTSTNNHNAPMNVNMNGLGQGQGDASSSSSMHRSQSLFNFGSSMSLSISNHLQLQNSTGNLTKINQNQNNLVEPGKHYCEYCQQSFRAHSSLYYHQKGGNNPCTPEHPKYSAAAIRF